MKNDKEVKELHCGGCGQWHDRGGRVRLPIEAKIKPVHGSITVFSMPHACLAAGLIGKDVPDEQVLNSEVLSGLAERKWDCSVERFLDDAKKLGVDTERAISKIGPQQGATIGWTSDGTELSRSLARETGVCPDLGITLAVLSRRVGDIFIGAREPDLNWETLFGSSFAVDEGLGPAPDLLSEPWNRYRWW